MNSQAPNPAGFRKFIPYRVRRLERAGRNVEEADALRDWHGRTMAMLSVSLEHIARGLEQSKQGNVVMAGEIRNELRAVAKAITHALTVSRISP